MRLTAIGSTLLLGACAGTPVDETQPVDRACTVSECFFEREVRDFEVIGDTTLIVYVGGQRCPFQVELDGTFCDMTFAPELFFRFPDRATNEERVCSYDRGVGVDGGAFTEDLGAPQIGGRRSPLDPFGNDPRPGGIGNQSQCRVLSIASITDDQLVELYVERGVVPPPPPIGPGQIAVGSQDGEESAAQPAAEEGAPEAETSRDREAGDEERTGSAVIQ